MPCHTHTGLFSATQTRQVKELANAGMRNPASIAVAVRSRQLTAASGGGAEGAGPAGATVNWGVQATPTSLTNYYAFVEPDMKPKALVDFLIAHPTDKIMVRSHLIQY